VSTPSLAILYEGKIKFCMGKDPTSVFRLLKTDDLSVVSEMRFINGL
jgi:hypothetical protein